MKKQLNTIIDGGCKECPYVQNLKENSEIFCSYVDLTIISKNRDEIGKIPIGFPDWCPLETIDE